MSAPRIVGDRYELIEQVGRGALGEVWRARHTGTGREHAVKLLHDQFATHPDIASRFEREARAAATIDDPRIVEVTDFGRDEDGALYMVMELVDGVPLSDLGPLDPAAALELFDRLLLGVEAAHTSGVVHRDLKPDNIMVVDTPDGRDVKLLDFGLAKLIGGAQLTRDGVVFGTPRYMAPEQATGEAVDHRADLYAVGSMLFEVLMGHPAVDGDEVREVLARQVAQPTPPIVLPPPHREIQAAVERVIHRATEKRPEDRFASAAEFRAALAIAARGEPNVRVRHKRTIAVASLVAALLVVAIVAALMLGSDPLDDIEDALDEGRLRSARKFLAETDGDAATTARYHRLAGHLAMADGNYEEAARAYRAAIERNPDLAADDKLGHDIRALAERKVDGVEGLVGVAARSGPPASATLLTYLAKSAPTATMRQAAYEGLERLGETERLDRFEFLSLQLNYSGAADCASRKWYVERLARLRDPRALRLFRRERARKGGPWGLAPASGCMKALLDRAIRDLTEGTPSHTDGGVHSEIEPPDAD